MSYDGPGKVYCLSVALGMETIVMGAREWRVWFADSVAYVLTPRPEGGAWVWAPCEWVGQLDQELCLHPGDALEELRQVLPGASVCQVGTTTGYVLAINRLTPSLLLSIESGHEPVFAEDELVPVRLAYAVGRSQEAVAGAVLRELATAAHLTAGEHRKIAGLCDRWAEFR